LNFLFSILERYTMKGIGKKTFHSTFNKKKKTHSLNVRNLACKMGCDKDAEQAALFHDFIEKGGSPKKLKNIVSPVAFGLVKGMTNKNNKDPLKSIKQKLKKLDNSQKINLIKIKLADRAANIQQRIKEDRLKIKYINKTADLVNYLYQEFPGNKQKIKVFIIKNFINKSNSLKRRIHV
jgi:tRNA(Ser,Leu) C12 N-acetylase TAN1